MTANEDTTGSQIQQPYTIGVIRETHVPQETRAPLTPVNCAQILALYGPRVSIVIESCQFRCYRDQEYADSGAVIVDKADGANLLLGVKPPSVVSLRAGATYAVFSHTIKRQPQNRQLLRSILDKGIRLLDWECMRDPSGLRLLGFGRWAGIVGAHNTLMAWARLLASGGRHEQQSLSFRLHEVVDWEAAKLRYWSEVGPHAMQGDGRVGNGSCELLDLLGLTRMQPQEFLARDDWPRYHPGVYTQLPADWLYRTGPGAGTWSPDFFSNPGGYRSVIWPFVTRANVLINGIYWDDRCAPLLTLADMQLPEFSVRLIGDVTCDIAPVASLPSTIRATTVDDPVFAFDSATGREVAGADVATAVQLPPGLVWVMAIDNLPVELPRDASSDFGDLVARLVLPEILPQASRRHESRVLHDATIAENGALTTVFSCLEDYAKGH